MKGGGGKVDVLLALPVLMLLLVPHCQEDRH